MRFISLMSGGIDSPVSTYLMLKKGVEVLILNMDSRPLGGDDEAEKVNELWKHLEGMFPGKVGLIRGKHGLLLSSFRDHANPKYTCVLCKRSMLKVADRLCDRYGAEGIIMGDSLGQVASQTLKNLAVVSQGVKHPILRPLIGFDKLDIEKIAKETGTFEISIRRTTGCLAAPKYPITKAELSRVEEESEKGMMEEVIEEVLSSIEEVRVFR
ncbi:MAG: hypothetical protein U9R75_12875 [Candidatus Thermoplasmatota archaeon]|nr:hypothetical protein [Candidatus Thermoplasmatota archaeon]